VVARWDPFNCRSTSTPSASEAGVLIPAAPPAAAVPVGNRRGRGGLDHRSLMARGEESGAEVSLLVVGQAAAVGQNDERGQVVPTTARARS
jgi:hypothetical protein